VADLLLIRNASVLALKNAFPKAAIDTSKDRCISITGGSLARKVDVVSSNWLDTAEYWQTGDKAYRGIQVLDISVPTRVKNFPFLHNQRIDGRDKETLGGLRRCIRLVKSIRSDSDNSIDFSSYDIASLCYNVPPIDLTYESDLGLLVKFLKFSVSVLKDEPLRSSLIVPNGTRKLFGGSEGAALNGLGALVEEVADVATAASKAQAA
jgi:hypothetical protein